VSALKKTGYAVILAVVCLCLGLSVFVEPVGAQAANEPTGFANVTLWVYPEYDDPSLLVMLEGKILGTTSPALVRFLVPSSAQLYSAGSKDIYGHYTGGPPARKPSQVAGWDEISYELKTDTFRVEYYDSIIKGNPDKTISYDFRSLYPISDLKVIVQVPKTADNFSVSPKGTPTSEDGFTVYAYTYGNPDPAQPLHFDISYTKASATPSISSTPAPTDAVQSWNFVPLMVVAGIMLVLVAIILVIRRGKEARAAPSHSFGGKKTRGARSGDSRNRFCNQCGKPIDGQAKFCSHCGSKVGKLDGDP
jgi:hypothetical protein